MLINLHPLHYNYNYYIKHRIFYKIIINFICKLILVKLLLSCPILNTL
jgi:hypothetical protein